jgi:hypothetical protein
MRAYGVVFQPELIELMKAVLEEAAAMLPEAKGVIVPPIGLEMPSPDPYGRRDGTTTMSFVRSRSKREGCSGFRKSPTHSERFVIRMRDNDNGREVGRNNRPQMLKHSLSQVVPLGQFESVGQPLSECGAMPLMRSLAATYRRGTLPFPADLSTHKPMLFVRLIPGHLNCRRQASLRVASFSRRRGAARG